AFISPHRRLKRVLYQRHTAMPISLPPSITHVTPLTPWHHERVAAAGSPPCCCRDFQRLVRCSRRRRRLDTAAGHYFSRLILCNGTGNAQNRQRGLRGWRDLTPLAKLTTGSPY